MLEYKQRSPNGTDGVYIQDVTIVGVQDLSKTVHPRIQKQFDLYLALTVDIGRSFNPTVEVFGDLKRDQNGKAVEFGAAFKVGELFANTGMKLVLDSEERIPADLINALIGKKFAFLKYISGVKKNDPTKPQWLGWDIVGKPGDHENLKKYFLSQVAKNKVRNYNPNPQLASGSFNPAASGADEDAF